MNTGDNKADASKAEAEPVSGVSTNDIKADAVSESGDRQHPGTAAPTEDKVTWAEPARTRGGRVFAAIALLVALASLGVSGYLWYQSQVIDKLTDASVSNTVVNLEGQLKDIKEAQSGAVQQHSQRSADLETAVQGIKTDLSTMQLQQADLSDSVAKVYAELDRNIDTWAIEEVEQLLLLANHRLRLAGDRDTALAALEIADQRLQDLGDPAFVETRALIADDIAKLQTIKPVDITGLALRLSSAAKVVDRLPLKTEPRLQASEANAQASDTKSSNVLANTGRDMWQSLSTLVRIQNTSEPRQPLLAPEQRYYLQENLRLQLLGAELALLRDAPQSYRDLLGQAVAWTDEYFNNEDEVVVQFKNDLSSMLQANLEPNLPDISTSVAALRAVKETKTTR
ncbi:MAG: uroporphyrinogen-III C-methyltransferase [Gammaproteobacteria bacterium]|nr:uroporphyrinogen-III C-methyltransferase [Gammaproteobacteria bacterium]